MSRGAWLVLVDGLLVHETELLIGASKRAQRESATRGRAAVARVGDASKFRVYENGKRVPL